MGEKVVAGHHQQQYHHATTTPHQHDQYELLGRPSHTRNVYKKHGMKFTFFDI